MPVTAKLSRQFYERLGDDVANELVNWFNMVDESYRTQLRELNELNFARFDAKVEERFARSDAKWEARFAKLDAKWEDRFVKLDAKWEDRFAKLDAKWEDRFARFESTVLQRFASTDTAIHRESVNHMRWMISVWLVQTGAIVATLLTVLRG